MVVVNFFSITSPVIKRAAKCKEIFKNNKPAGLPLNINLMANLRTYLKNSLKIAAPIIKLIKIILIKIKNWFLTNNMSKTS
jgi:hypothetical protein